MKNRDKLSKKNEILVVLYEMSHGNQSAFKYEDVIVKLFKKYPGDFHLRGYPEYPDTSNQSFYSLRKEGLIQVRNKFVTLSEKGIICAKQLTEIKSSPSRKRTPKLTRDITSEIERIRKTDAFRLFTSERQSQIVDTDLFNYLGTTVRAERTDFRARIKTVEDVVNAVKGDADYKIFVDIHNFLFQKFSNLITTKLSIGYPRREHE